jgi:hypothetical protein
MLWLELGFVLALTACSPPSVGGEKGDGADGSADDTAASDDTAHDLDDTADGDDTAVADDTGCEPQTWFFDSDGDGYGDPDNTVEACEPPDGAVADATDCADTDPTAFPGSHATEVPGDGVDTDCDGLDACTDLNCDGWADLVFAHTDDGADDYSINSVVYLGGPDGFSADARWDVPTIGAMGVDAGDIDGDGYIDLAFASVQDGVDRVIDSRVYYGDGAGFSMDRATALPTIGCADPTVADVDQDGWLDVVYSNRFRGGDPNAENYSNDSYVYWGGAAGLDPSNRLALPTVGAARSRVSDLDGDGFMDIVFAHGVMDLFFMDSSNIWWGSATGWADDRVTELESVFPEGLAVGDVDNDGDSDIVFTTWLCIVNCAGSNMVYEGDGGQGYSSDDRFQLPDVVGAVDVQIADLDGDGFNDLVLADGGVDWSGAFATSSHILWGSATGFDSGAQTDLPTTAASECGVGDFDEDGDLDLACASHYEPADGGPEVSQVYWNDAGFDASRVTELPTQHAAGMTVVGAN